MTTIDRLSVAIPGREYDVLLGHDIVRDIGSALEAACPASRYVIISDSTVASQYASDLEAAIGTLAPVDVLDFPAGERSKSRALWAELSDAMLARQAGRDAAVIALGGGVTGDLAGFVAATYQRGVPVVQIPTTLLAMIDSSVGGKTGVDTDHGKNLIGAFHQPNLVVIDTRYLDTLPSEHFVAGLAEALKHGVIADADYFRRTVSDRGAILNRDPEALRRLVGRSIEIKSGIVAEDERESGRRAVLNFGHTVGHAIEACSDFSLLHGTCVAIGMQVETRIAQRLDLCHAELPDTIENGLSTFGLPTSPPDIEPNRLLDTMRQDKKNRRQDVRFSLPADLGTMVPGPEHSWTVPVPENVTVGALRSTS